MVDRAPASRAEAIERFALALRELRTSAGSPSFREMSGRSHAISHTTLHEAAQGNRFPSWATTVEFVKACDSDPTEYRDRWEATRRFVRSDAGRSEIVPDAVSDGGPPEDRSTPPRRNRRLIAFAGAGLVAVVVSVLVAMIVRSSRDGDPTGATSTAPNTAFAAGDCPVRQPDPPKAGPLHQGDADEFIGDVTVPDCTHIARGRSVTKVWRLRNSGTVQWRGYTLHRIDQPQRRGDCQTISDVLIEDTAPGQIVDVRVEVATPQNSTFCFVRFAIEDANGRVAFPAKRPVNFQIIVD